VSFVLPPKSANEIVDRIYDWSPALGDDVITNATLTVTSGTVTFDNLDWSPQKVIFRVLGGVQGETATFRNVVTTAGDQTLDQDFSIYIQAEAVETPFGPSTLTKGDIVAAAYEEMGLPNYEFDMSAEEWVSSLKKLDLLMAARPFVNLPLGYNFPATLGTSGKLDPVGFADTFSQTIAISLAKRIAPSKGKQLSSDTKKAYQAGLNDLLAQASTIPTQRLRGNTPLGSGNRWRATWAPYARPSWVGVTIDGPVWP
jgi:hypothetical protein